MTHFHSINMLHKMVTAIEWFASIDGVRVSPLLNSPVSCKASIQNIQCSSKHQTLPDTARFCRSGKDLSTEERKDVGFAYWPLNVGPKPGSGADDEPLGASHRAEEIEE